MFLYIHIPFCESKCKYCRFASTWNLQKLQIEKYINFITSPSISTKTSPSIPLPLQGWPGAFLWEEREVEQLNSPSPLKGEGARGWGFKKEVEQLKSIYFWWWTPWVLNLDQLEKILSNFITSPQPSPLGEKGLKSTEITLETTPNKVTKENIIWWQKLWINRISMWVQSLNDKTLKEIGREDKGDILEALDILKALTLALSPGERGLEREEFFNISVDFIIGLPYVKKWWVKKDIEYLLGKYDFIKHVSVYMLEEITLPSIPLLWEEREVEQLNSPSPLKGEGARGWGYPWSWEENSIEKEDYLWEYIEVKDFLQSKWFNRYEISNFAKSWFECKHNMAYWNHSEVKAIWLWASWYEKGERYSFPDRFKDFYENKNIFSEKLTKEDIFTEKVMFGLRTSWLNEEVYKKLNEEKINNFIKDRYLFIENKKLKLTDKWILVLDYILSEV